MKTLFVFLTISLTFGCESKQPLITGREGEVMPEFKGLLTDNVTILNSADIPKGKPSALLYFAPWCPYSKAQITEIVNNIDELKGINFYILSPSPFKQVNSFCKGQHLEKFRNIVVVIDYTNFFSTYFNAIGFPSIAIYNNNKKLVNVFLGETKSTQIISTAYNK